MNSTIRTLSILLVAQLVFTAISFRMDSDLSVYNPIEPLLTESPADASSVTITDSESSLELQKAESVWVIPTLKNFPASQQKIDSFLESLADLKRTWPVGTTTHAMEAFEVADKNHQRKITIDVPGKPSPIELYLGSSPGFKKIHARMAGEANSYSVPFNSYEASTDPQFWVDKEYLYRDRSTWTALSVNDIRLNKDGDSWISEDGTALDSDKLNSLLTSLAQLKFDSVRMEAAPSSSPVKTIELQYFTGDNSVQYIAEKYTGDNDAEIFLLRASDKPEHTLMLNALQFNLLDKMTLDTLIAEANSTEGSKDSDPATQAKDAQ